MIAQTAHAQVEVSADTPMVPGPVALANASFGLLRRSRALHAAKLGAGIERRLPPGGWVCTEVDHVRAEVAAVAVGEVQGGPAGGGVGGDIEGEESGHGTGGIVSRMRPSFNTLCGHPSGGSARAPGGQSSARRARKPGR
jgi:hypothetical protein